ncbi:unnamed protein product [Cuscuta epithymum]|uniref:AN1-type domain-containing protein n=1 Tax=Cuscuta epithymum TaxID=186058 RepID=A0AAV0D456_9ASTE|nr:unnamed protein product [Cuscuta epithymum]
MGGGTEAFPDLGSHCQNSDCRQLDFLPFRCDACDHVFCSEHRSYKSHDCPKSDHNNRKVVICETCSMSMETTGCDGEDEKAVLLRHEKSGHCDPKKKKKPTCPVRRCKDVLTFSNTSYCKTCRIRVCLKHRFPADHGCNAGAASSISVGSRLIKDLGGVGNKFMIAFAARNGKDCGKDGQASKSSQSSTPSSVKAC